MAQLSDSEIHAIVQRVLGRMLDTSSAQVAPASPGATSPAAPAAAVSPAFTAPSGEKKAIAIGSDHGGYALKEILKPYLEELGFAVIDCGTNSKEAVDYPDFAHAVAQLVSQGKAWRGVVIDGAGIGSCMVANKVPGVRAAMCYDVSTALNSREHNDANLLTLGAGMIGDNLARQILKTWLGTEFLGGRHARRVDKIVAVEKQYLKA